ncbi:hypothetical protein HBA93_21440 [Ochrobactrum sp. SFR4]|nr:hypothetical protein [Ochrobactrum sp. SFR4]
MANDLLAPVGQRLGQLHHTRQDIGISVDPLSLTQESSPAFNCGFARRPDQFVELMAVQRTANALVTPLA